MYGFVAPLWLLSCPLWEVLFILLLSFLSFILLRFLQLALYPCKGKREKLALLRNESREPHFFPVSDSEQIWWSGDRREISCTSIETFQKPWKRCWNLLICECSLVCCITFFCGAASAKVQNELGRNPHHLKQMHHQIYGNWVHFVAFPAFISCEVFLTFSVRSL